MSAQRTAGGRRLAHIKRHWQLYLLLLPGIIYILVFKYWPMAGIQIAFKDFKPLKGIWGSPWATSKGSLEVIALVLYALGTFFDGGALLFGLCKLLVKL